MTFRTRYGMTADQRKASRYIPANSTEITHPSADAVVYTYELHGKPYAVAYKGTAGKSVWHHKFFTEASREKHIADFFAGVDETITRKAERKAELSGPHSLKIGDILHYSWGWEQTNCEFHQVVAVTAHTVTTVEIGSEEVPESTYSHGMACMLMAIPSAFVKEAKPIKRRVSGNNYISADHGSMSKWSGTPKYSSWYA